MDAIIDVRKKVIRKKTREAKEKWYANKKEEIEILLGRHNRKDFFEIF